MDDDRFTTARNETTRRSGHNPGTRVFTAGELARALRGPTAPSVKDTFFAAWPVIQSRARGFGPGLIAVAVDGEGVAATVGLKARGNRPVSAIVGRHASTDLYLPDDATLSLRHLVVLLLPRGSGNAPLRYRILDLRSGRGFQDEHHRPVQAVESDGPMFVCLGSYTVLLHPIEPGAPLPEDPELAWATLPPRTYRRQAIPTEERGAEGTTRVQVVDGPSFVALANEGQGRLGILRVSSTRGATAFAVGDRAARSGILLGRYDRCDNAGLRVLDDPNVSRVHVLILEIDGAIYAVDTGSTNGVRHAGARFRERALGAHDVLELGHGLADVEWLAAH